MSPGKEPILVIKIGKPPALPGDYKSLTFPGVSRMLIKI
jgi:hypothetical protein